MATGPASQLADTIRWVPLPVRGTGEDTIAIGPDRVELRVVADPADLAADTVIVRRNLSDQVKQRFETEGAGWFDLRRLVIRAPGLIIDRDLPQPTERRDRRINVLAGPVVSAVTFDALINWPEPGTSNRALARLAGVTSGGVSLATRRLIDAGLLTENRRATRDLFWAAAREWRPTWVDTDVEGLGNASVAVGNAVAATRGAPVLSSANDPPELLVASEADLQVAALRPKSADTIVGRAAVAPSPVALRLDRDREGAAGPQPAESVVVALVLATDPGRGAEIVEGWDGDHVWC